MTDISISAVNIIKKEEIKDLEVVVWYQKIALCFIIVMLCSYPSVFKH